MENWKKVKGYDGYEVSDKHRVRNERGVVLTIWVDKDSRHYVAMQKNGETRRRYIAELVEAAFTPEQEAQTAQESPEQSEAGTTPTPKKTATKTAKKAE